MGTSGLPERETQEFHEDLQGTMMRSSNGESSAHGHPRGRHDHGGMARRATNRKRLTIALSLVVVYMIAEVIGGLVANSLALLADAGHMLSDAAALGLSLFALWIADRPPTPRRTYGYHRAEILAALVNGVTLVVVAVLVFIEAWRRFSDPPPVQGALVMGIATGGLVVNLAGLWLLDAGREDSLNVRGAWLHMLTDALGSVGAILGGFLVWALGWRWADPAVSVLIGLLVIYSSWHLISETVSVLMESAPSGLDADTVRAGIATVDGVADVHDVHIWSITTGMVKLSAHLKTTGTRPDRDILREVHERMKHEFGVDHCTIQIEHEPLHEPAGHP